MRENRFGYVRVKLAGCSNGLNVGVREESKLTEDV